jgi:hypothetical protein
MFSNMWDIMSWIRRKEARSRFSSFSWCWSSAPISSFVLEIKRIWALLATIVAVSPLKSLNFFRSISRLRWARSRSEPLRDGPRDGPNLNLRQRDLGWPTALHRSGRRTNMMIYVDNVDTSGSLNMLSLCSWIGRSLRSSTWKRIFFFFWLVCTVDNKINHFDVQHGSNVPLDVPGDHLPRETIGPSHQQPPGDGKTWQQPVQSRTKWTLLRTSPRYPLISLDHSWSFILNMKFGTNF